MSDETVDSSVRVRAARALGDWGSTRLLPDLECIAQQDADEHVRRAARKALEQIRQRTAGK
ncbi:HEAT domain protein repeat-containing protein (fragment) [Candidatus Methylomirabilis oxygeniifera]|uniref:HEAT domain protein repeat-containing protein n=1 Tax=Methylomirabilis oxygeniifera TaxID=671143 RepID=D5MK92_METO1